MNDAPEPAIHRLGDRRADPLAAALLPVLLHELNNTTQLLGALNTLLAQPDGSEFLAQRCDALAAAASEVDELGWLLALSSAACGADLLLERRERAGLEPLVRLVDKALRRDGRSLARTEGVLPALEPAVGDGWELPWALAGWLWSSARALPERTPLQWTLARSDERASLSCDVRADPELTALAARLPRALPGLECRFDHEGAHLQVPIGWLPPLERKP